ncbi:hypothetical protein [Mangrovivirga cuniculi]|uniref:hypothetical protein n=1 Tax=Mangrovivirga cuniculi TaxID=2715131 RepID=UPI00158602CB|nr:hypothetical protein [Mangrovivirga cuniculi]
MGDFFRATLVIYLIFQTYSIFGQSNGSSEGPYLFPMNPHNRNYLAGTMGELRSTHFHGGLDIKTGGVEGWDVYAVTGDIFPELKFRQVDTEMYFMLLIQMDILLFMLT